MDAKQLFIRLVFLPLLILIFMKITLWKTLINKLLRIIIKRNDPIVIRTPEQRFRGLEDLGYHFKPHYASLPIGGGKTLPRVHYVDEGPREATETVLCLHGEPSWSFLYRHMINVLVAAGYRVVAPDFVGFGKSDKFTQQEDYTHQMHTMTVRLLLDHLKLSNVTLVCQDWGGLTGLSVVKDCGAVFSRIVIMNTGLPTGFSFNLLRVGSITPFLTWRSFVQMMGTGLPVRWIFKTGIKSCSDKVLDAYAAPFPSLVYRAGAARWPMLVPVSSRSPVAPDMRQTRDYLKTQWNKPALIMFSDDDPITGAEVKSFETMLPHAKKVTVRGGGHFLQEMKGEELAENVIKFTKGTN